MRWLFTWFLFPSETVAGLTFSRQARRPSELFFDRLWDTLYLAIQTRLLVSSYWNSEKQSEQILHLGALRERTGNPWMFNVTQRRHRVWLPTAPCDSSAPKTPYS